MKARGLIQVYTGEGKGKSTAAIGQAVRAAGHDFKVGLVTFFKDPDAFGCGECVSLEKVGIEMFVFARKHPHFYKDVSAGEVRGECLKGLGFIEELFRDESWDMLVLDEINVAVRDTFLSEEEVLSLLEAKPEKLELILTGRGATGGIVDKADLVSEVRKVKHPYDRGIQGRKGVEY
ncbi:MAG: cob(I)yrinic acid a,c-diamide adenosyltransferase [Dehalococcoidia bacterium]|nr:cob(I)yrinic acid a,c-diamide adenosyltransferase [Dehalococcoidia bacterium]